MKNYLETLKKSNETFAYMVPSLMRNKHAKICLANKTVIPSLDTIGQIKQFIPSPDMYWSNKKGTRKSKRDEQIEKFAICQHSEALFDEV